ncbi:MAG: hypothetical protein HKN21_17800, partial [Candidatus Eisenbacteria bacterium]|nr:hypothetical protein [Candidatus Eisenbacteria bacterium]
PCSTLAQPELKSNQKNAPEEKPKLDPEQWGQQQERPSRWPLVAAGAGLAVGIGVGVWLKSEADDRYERYLLTATPADQDNLFEESQKLDRLSLIGWGIAQASFVALFYLLTREQDRPLIPTTGEPVVSVNREGILLGWTIAP